VAIVASGVKNGEVGADSVVIVVVAVIAAVLYNNGFRMKR
jgi:hypothetical protein